MRRLALIKLESASPCNIDSLLINKKHLKALHLSCTERTGEIHSEEEISTVEETFEKLIPPYNLETLGIVDFFGQRYPTWLGTGHLSSLKFLTLKGCKFCMCLPPVGQLSNLKFLRIHGATAVTKIGTEFVGCGVGNPGFAGAVAFPILEILIIENMPNWEEWTFAAVGEEAITTNEEVEEEEEIVEEKVGSATPRMRLLPRLRQMKLIQCPKLRDIPQLGQEAISLKDIEFISLGLKVVENFPFLSERLVVSRCEGLERVSNIPHVDQLFAISCLNLICIEKLDKLQQMFFIDDMQIIVSLWLPGLQEEHKRLHGDDLDVYIGSPKSSSEG